MSLRTQLLLVALLTLVLPWAGWRYVTEMEGVLRTGLEQSLQASATTMAGAFAPATQIAARHPGSDGEAVIYAHALPAAPRVDGYRDDWGLGEEHDRPLGNNGRFRAGIYDRHLYLHVDIADSQVVYPRAPGQSPYGDRLLLATGVDTQRWLVLNTAAPGVVPARGTSPPAFLPGNTIEERVFAVWVTTQAGYAAEVRIPLELLGSEPVLGLGVVDVTPGSGADAGGYTASLATSWRHPQFAPGPLIYQQPELAGIAAPFLQPGRRLRIVDAQGWVLYDGGSLRSIPRPDMPADDEQGFFANLLRLILSREDPTYDGFEQPPGFLAEPALRTALNGEAQTRWYRRSTDASSIVAAAVPIVGTQGVQGALILETGSDAILTLTNDALVRLLGFTLLASVVAALALLGYATWLSVRIHRLAYATGTAMGPKGDIRASVPGQKARDEIGALSRSVGDLLRRLRDYTDYLRSLKGKLAHELRTPLAVVSTSLDNIAREQPPAALAPYLGRIREGTERLDALINAMSEATAIEQAVTDTARQRFDLAEVISSCVIAYRDVHAKRRFRLDGNGFSGSSAIGGAGSGTMIAGSPDLIAQMLDKLIDNAVSFSPDDSEIVVELKHEGGLVELAMTNEGPPLPEHMKDQLFDSLVSVRDHDGRSNRHLGLGLYIVALIVRFHGGTVSATNRDDNKGVTIRAQFPAAAHDPSPASKSRG